MQLVYDESSMKAFIIIMHPCACIDTLYLWCRSLVYIIPIYKLHVYPCFTSFSDENHNNTVQARLLRYSPRSDIIDGIASFNIDNSHPH